MSPSELVVGVLPQEWWLKVPICWVVGSRVVRSRSGREAEEGGEEMLLL